MFGSKDVANLGPFNSCYGIAVILGIRQGIVFNPLLAFPQNQVGIALFLFGMMNVKVPHPKLRSFPIQYPQLFQTFHLF